MTRRLSLCCVVAALVVFDAVAFSHPPSGLLQGGIYPSLSPDSKSIVVSHQGSIWTVPREGGEMTQLTDGSGFDCRPVWSPDATRIAYVEGRNAFTGLLKMIRASDGEPLPLAKRHIAQDQLFFSPDGNRLLSIYARENVSALCWLDLRTGQLGDKLFDAKWGMRFALSHDGESIALVTTQDVMGQQGGNDGPACDIWTIPAAGGQPTKVTRFPGRVYEIVWHADNKSLLAVSNVGGVHNDLWNIPLGEPQRGARKLTFGQADEDSPSVDRSGRYLAYTDNCHGSTVVAVCDLSTGQTQLVSATRRRFKTATGRLRLSLHGQVTGEPVVARVSLRHEGGKYYAPPASLYRMLRGRGEMHFYCDGECQMELPVGTYTVRVARGPEYPVVTREIVVAAGRDVDESISMKRWIDQRSRGWYSGESHIHANYGYGQWYNSPQTMRIQSSGEDLIVSNFMVANSEADGVFDREFFRGEPDPASTEETILYWNQEFRSTIWGHLTLLNLHHLVEPIFTGFAETTHPHDHPTNVDIADLTHDQHGHVNYTHAAHNIKDPYLTAYAAKALPVDVALGKVDSIDVMGSNHLATVPLWYRLLNCGFQVPASAGTDCFLNRVISKLPGQDRVYVRVEGEFTYQKWIDALRAGHTFVTNGPMLEFTVNDKMAGEVVELDSPGVVKIRATVHSQFPIDRYEVVSGGKVIWSADVKAGHLGEPIDVELPVERSGWLALRAAGPKQADQPAGSVFAHSGAIYLRVKGTVVDSAEDAAYFATWIDRLRGDIRMRNRVPSRHQVHVESQLAEARRVFNGLVVPSHSADRTE